MGIIRTELEEQWVWIILNRPDKRNALNPELISELDQRLATFEDGKFKIQPDQYNVVEELAGTIDYPQPAASDASTTTTGG